MLSAPGSEPKTFNLIGNQAILTASQVCLFVTDRVLSMIEKVW